MDPQRRNKRVRLLVRAAQRKYKEQGRQIDILCNDMIAANRNFLKRLDTISFAANFYESLIGITELDSLFYNTSKLIKDKIGNVNVTFFLRHSDNFSVHVSEGDGACDLEGQGLEHFFSGELLENICNSNQLCSIETLLAMGLNIKPALLNKISAFTIPLSQFGMSPGFILIYRSGPNRLTAEELNNIAAVTPGLARAIQSCQAFSRTTH